MATRQARLQIARDGSAVVVVPRGEAAHAGAAAARRAGTRGKLGFDDTGARRPDRHLPAIAALIDPRQFELITQPSSGLIAIQGSAGSGKTTIGLHRIAYLAFADPRRFRPEKMLVIVYQRALATYVSRVLPSLDVEGVPVMTFAGWADAARRAAVPHAGRGADRRDAAAGDARQGARRDAADHRRPAGGAGAPGAGRCCRRELAGKADADAVLAFWDSTSGPVDARVTALAQLGARRQPRPGDAQRAREHRAHAARAHARRGRRVGGAAHRSRGAGRRASRATRPGCSRPASSTTSTAGASRAIACAPAGRDDDDDETFALDAEDDALLLRIYQRQRGRLPAPTAARAPLAYEHLMVDEVQDFSPLELAVLLDATSAQRSVTLAGDTAQAIAPEHGFSNWAELLDFLGIAHERVEPLRVSYRSTREIVDVAEHVLGPLHGRRAAGGAARGRARRVVPVRVGGRVRRVPVARAQGAGAQRARRLGGAAGAPPRAGAPRTTRRSSRAEVPALRLVADQDFSFSPGIDVTDVRQSKGLEFDIVILLDVNDASYPATDDARRLLHVAMTRAAHQLWITYVGAPSPLLPDSLR